MPLCCFCQEIPGHFFQHDPKLERKLSQIERIGHLPIPYLQNSAANGCPLCKILASGIGGGDLPPEIRGTSGTNLRLALIDPHQAFDVCVGFDDYNHVFYYHIPPILSK